MRTLKEINDQLNKENDKIFPFINLENKITKLEKGLYKKHKCNFRGITCVKIPVTTGENFITEVRLNGYYDIPYDMLIVPVKIQMSKEKQAFIDQYVNKGYKVVDNLPQIRPRIYDAETEEYQSALQARADYISNKQAEKKMKQDLSKFPEYLNPTK